MNSDTQPSLSPADLTIEELRARLDLLVQTSSPGLRGFAAWLADQPEELAFRSVRGLADAAGTDPNVVVRTMKALGFPGYGAAQRTAQQALRLADKGYVSRAEALQQIDPDSLLLALAEAARNNTRQVFSRQICAVVEEIVPHLIGARRVHCIGVRIAYGLAHYFTYRGGIAHANIVPAPAQPGLILDSLIDSGPDDVVIVISFAHYSAEVVRAANVARKRGARILALTDRRDSPLARDAWRVLRVPLEGPNVMYSITGAMMIVEMLLELMAGQDPQARSRIQTFESGLLSVGAYLRGS
jgi:DNA-binding MurR/RpiR family transcriptional regulator